VSLVGYDDSRRAWLIRNSWGKEWGEKGFAWISWDDASGVGANTWGFEIPSSADTVSVNSPADREYVSGQYQLVAQRQSGRAEDIQFHIQTSEGRDLSSLSCSTVSDQACSSLIDTTTLKEGRYEIYAQSGSVKSQVREFYVINSVPKLSLSFAGINVDLSQPVTGRPEFTVTSSSSPVPLQHVEFMVVDQHGKVAPMKGNSYVLPQMKMGWRSMTVPNGQYKIYFHGEMTYKGKVYGVDSNTFSITVKN
jgi:hypothetical protein